MKLIHRLDSLPAPVRARTDRGTGAGEIEAKCSG
jgi:hypothetical protein